MIGGIAAVAGIVNDLRLGDAAVAVRPVRERDRAVNDWRDQALRMIKAETTLARIRAELNDADEAVIR